MDKVGQSRPKPDSVAHIGRDWPGLAYLVQVTAASFRDIVKPVRSAWKRNEESDHETDSCPDTQGGRQPTPASAQPKLDAFEMNILKSPLVKTVLTILVVIVLAKQFGPKIPVIGKYLA